MDQHIDDYQFAELAAVWRPVGGIDLDELKRWTVAAQLSDSQMPRSDSEWEDLARAVDQWVRDFTEDREPFIHARPHLAGLNAQHPEFPKHFLARRADFTPPLAQSLDAIADLHPWIGWMETENKHFRGDVLPRLAVRMHGLRAHGLLHKPPFVWDALLREEGVDPLGDPSVMSPRALQYILSYLERTANI